MESLSQRIFCFDRYLIIAILLIAGLIIFKIPVLSLPYFWDEAWSYMPAINQLNRHGLSLMPGVLPAEVYRGHPLLFYFLAAGWMKLFGSSFFAMHSFALLITCAMLFAIFITARNLFSPVIGIVAMVIFIFQPMVLGQATFVLPEMLMGFWSLCCLYFYIKDKLLWYVFFATCLLYTKESGVVLVFLILCRHFYRTLFAKEKIFSWYNFRKFTILFLPVLFVLCFFLLQKKIMGWFFFPDHIGMIVHEAHEIKEKFRLCFYLLFIEQKKNIILIIAVSFFIFHFINSLTKGKEVMKKDEKQFFLLGPFFILFYLIFCAMNSFTNRYLLSAVPVWSILSAAPIIWFAGKNKMVLFGIVSILVTVFYLENANIIAREKDKFSAEYNLGFSDAVLVQKEICDYLQAGSYAEKRIYATFLYSIYLTNPDAGYLHKDNVFKNISNEAPGEAEFIIYSSIEKDPSFDSYSKIYKLTLVKRFERGYAWAELYKRNKEADESR